MYVQEPTGKEWELCPAGEYQAVLVDLIDLGWQMVEFNGQKRGMYAHVCPVFQIVNEVTENGNLPLFDSEGNLFEIRYPTPFGMPVKWSVKEGKESNWVKFLQSLFGTQSGTEIAESALKNRDFDADGILGANAIVTVRHVQNKDGTKTYANIVEMARWRNNMGAPSDAVDYVRVHEREGYSPPDFPTDRPFPGDWQTGTVDPDYDVQSRSYSNGQPATRSSNGASTAPAPKAATPSAPKQALPNDQPMTQGQRTTIIALARGQWGADAAAELRNFLMQHYDKPLDKLSASEAERVVEALKYPAEKDEFSEDGDPFGD